MISIIVAICLLLPVHCKGYRTATCRENELDYNYNFVDGKPITINFSCNDAVFDVSSSSSITTLVTYNCTDSEGLPDDYLRYSNTLSGAVTALKRGHKDSASACTTDFCAVYKGEWRMIDSFTCYNSEVSSSTSYQEISTVSRQSDLISSMTSVSNMVSIPNSSVIHSITQAHPSSSTQLPPHTHDTTPQYYSTTTDIMSLTSTTGSDMYTSDHSPTNNDTQLFIALLICIICAVLFISPVILIILCILSAKRFTRSKATKSNNNTNAQNIEIKSLSSYSIVTEYCELQPISTTATTDEILVHPTVL
jgi:hypothetical protein